MTPATTLEGPPVGASPGGPSVTLVACRPFTYLGNRLGKGEVLRPQPSGRLRSKLSSAGFVVEMVDPVAQVAAIVPDGYVCPVCAKVVKTPTGLKVHQSRVHGGR
jgi:hypothetical protein